MTIIYEDADHRILTIGEQSVGGAYIMYAIEDDNADPKPDVPLATVHFQDGPPATVGVNGITNEDLLHIVKHRLEGFQSGDFPCMENSRALRSVRDAIHALESRTLDRENRGVDGKYEK